jgi:hypothetical protein
VSAIASRARLCARTCTGVRGLRGSVYMNVCCVMVGSRLVLSAITCVGSLGSATPTLAIHGLPLAIHGRALPGLGCVVSRGTRGTL